MAITIAWGPSGARLSHCIMTFRKNLWHTAPCVVLKACQQNKRPDTLACALFTGGKMSEYLYKSSSNMIRMFILIIILFSITACSWPKVRIKDDEYYLRPAQAPKPSAILLSGNILEV